VDYRTVMRHIDYGRGKAGTVLGPPCSVYRMVPGTSTGNYLDTANRIATNIRSYRKITTKTSDLESPTRSMGTLFYEQYVDGEFYLTGDVFVENDPFYGSGATEVDYTTTQFEAYCLAFHGPQKKMIAARIDRVGLIYRPSETPDDTGFWSPTLPSGQMQPLVPAVAGAFSFGAVGATAAYIPMGLMSMARTFREAFRDIPGDTRSTQWFCYLPPLDGYTPRAGDRIINNSNDFTTASRYVVLHPYEQEAGIQGSQLVLEREVDPG
jgi:hypothetical protein